MQMTEEKLDKEEILDKLTELTLHRRHLLARYDLLSSKIEELRNITNDIYKEIESVSAEISSIVGALIMRREGD